MCACGLWNLPVAWHMHACVIEDNFPPHCVPGSTHTLRCAAQCRTKVCHTVPHAAMLFLSHAAPEQMAWARRRKQLWSWMADPTHLGATEPTSDNKKDCVCALGLNIQLKYYQNYNMAKCNIQLFDKCVITCHLKWSIVLLQSCLGPK